MSLRTPLILLPLPLILSCGPKEVADAEGPSSLYELVETGTFAGDLPVNRYVFKNGLNLIVLEDHSAPVVAYQTWYGVGSALEVEGKTGLAHLFEHMMFKATSEYPDGHFDKTLEGIGAHGLNAWTWLDETTYIEAVPKEAVRQVAELEATRMTKLVVDQQAFESEREVVINERRLRVDNDPYGQLNEKLYAAGFQSHTYGWPTIGWMKDLEGLTVEDCVDFYKTWYAPNNATIVLSGDIAHGDAAALVADVYGGLAPSTLPDRPIPVEPEQKETRRLELTQQTGTDRIQVLYKVPAYTHDDIPAIFVLDAILTAGRSGRLKRALIDTGLATEVSSFAIGLKHPGVFEMEVIGVEGATAEQLEAALFAELARIAESGVDAAEVERGANQWKAKQWGEAESASGKADLIGWSWIAAGDWRRADQVLAAVAAVEPSDIQRVAKAYFGPERATVAMGRAAEKSDEVAQATAQKARGNSPALVTRAASGVAALERGALVEVELSGADVALHYDPSSPLLLVDLGWPAGVVAETHPGVANLTAHMLLRGTKTRSRQGFEEALERIGATVEPTVSADSLELSARVPADQWPAFIALLTEALTEPAFDAEELDQLKGEVTNEIKMRADDDQALAGRAFQSAWFGKDHPYGRAVQGTLSSLEAITPRDLAAFHKRWLHADNAVVVVGGAFDDKAQEDLAGLLSKLEGDVPALPEVAAVSAPKGRKVIIVDKPERTQVQVVLGHNGPSHLDDSFPAFLLGNDVMGGGSFSARLMKQVRDERGWSYYAYSYARPMARGSSYQAVLAPGVEYATDAVQLVLDIMAQTRDGGLTAEEFDLMKSASLKSAPFLSDTTTKRASLDFERRLTGYDPVAHTKAMASVTMEQAAAAVAAALDPEHAVIVLVATAADVKEKAAALGEVSVVSTDQVE